jgi:hypothetical protein
MGMPNSSRRTCAGDAGKIAEKPKNLAAGRGNDRIVDLRPHPCTETSMVIGFNSVVGGGAT